MGRSRKGTALRGNCYVASEALYHLLGGKASGWKACNMRTKTDTHWFLRHTSGFILDPTAKQFSKRPNYSRGRGSGFLTKRPSKRAKILMDKILWNER